MENLNNNIELNVGLLWFSAVITLFILLGVVTDKTRSRPFINCFTALLATNILMLLGESGLWIFGGSPDNIPILKLCAFLSFGLGTVLEVLYAYCLIGFVRERQKVSWKYAKVIAVIGAVYLCLVVISLFNGMLFDFDSNGYYVDGEYYFIVRFLDFIIILLEIFTVIRFWKILTLKGNDFSAFVQRTAIAYNAVVFVLGSDSSVYGNHAFFAFDLYPVPRRADTTAFGKGNSAC